jgi:hypothetical protein
MLVKDVPGSEYSPVQPDLGDGSLEIEMPSLLSAGVLGGGGHGKEIPKMVPLPYVASVFSWSDGVTEVCAKSSTEDDDVNAEGAIKTLFCRKEDFSRIGRSTLTLKSSATSCVLLVIVVLDIVTGCEAQSCKVWCFEEE